MKKSPFETLDNREVVGLSVSVQYSSVWLNDSVYDWLTINFPLQCHCWTEHSMISSHDNQISAAHIGFSFQVQSLPSFLALVHVVFSNFCELRVVSFFNVCFRKNCNKTFTEFGFCIIKWIIKLHVWLWQIT